MILSKMRPLPNGAPDDPVACDPGEAVSPGASQPEERRAPFNPWRPRPPRVIFAKMPDGRRTPANAGPYFDWVLSPCARPASGGAEIARPATVEEQRSYHGTRPPHSPAARRRVAHARHSFRR